METNDDEDDDFQSSSRSKSKLQHKRRNKLSSRSRLKSQPDGNENSKIDCDLFSPVSCSVARKTRRTNKETAVISLSDNENDSLQRTTIPIKYRTNRDKVHFESGESKVTLAGEASKSSQDLSTSEISISNVSSTNSVEKKNAMQDDKKEKARLGVDTSDNFQSNNVEDLIENSDSQVKEQNEPTEKSISSQCSILEDKPAVSKTYVGNVLGELKNEHDNKSLSCPLPENQKEEINVSVPNENVINSNKKEKNKKEREVNLEILPQFDHPTPCSSVTEETSPFKCYSKNVSNDISNDRISKYFTEEMRSGMLCAEMKNRSASLEHLNDSRSENDSVSQEKDTSNEAIPCGIVSEKNDSDHLLLASDDASKKVHSCPLCWKTFEMKQSQLLHMKGCAARHSVTTKQLLDAVELQEKQTAERQALGLPNIPTANAVRKSSTRRNTGGGGGGAADSNLQLALALSASIQEAEEQKQLDEEECLMEAGFVEEVVEKQKSMLEKYGFTSSRPVLPSSITRPKQSKGNKNKNKKTATVLTNRTKEDRERIITEKVAIVLIGEENATSAASVSNDGDLLDVGSIGTTENLQKYERQTYSLWNASSFKEELQSHYVQGLSDVITPCRTRAGDKLKHLSQVPGRNVTPIKQTVETPDKGFCPSTSLVGNEKQREVLNSSAKKLKARRSLMDPSAERNINRKSLPEKKNLAETLISDWRSMLNKNAMSDIKIIVEQDQEIPAHKLVFYARCRSILQDVIIETSSDSSSSMIVWVDISYRAALAFLQFIYCGLTSKLLRLEEKDMSNIRKLAQRYKVTELLEHLKVVNRVRTKVIKHSTSSVSQYSEEAKKTPLKSLASPKNWDIITGSSLQHTELVSKSPGILRNKQRQSKDTSLASPKSESSIQIVPLTPKSTFCDALQVDLTPEKRIASDDITSTEHLVKSNEKLKSPVSQTKNPSNVNSTDSREFTARSESPDLFMEDNEDASQVSEGSKFNIDYLLKMLDICLTQPQNNPESSSNKMSPKSISGSLSKNLKQNEQEITPQKISPKITITALQSSQNATPQKVSPVKSISESPSGKDCLQSNKHKESSLCDSDASTVERSSPVESKVESQDPTGADEENKSVSSIISSRNHVKGHNSANDSVDSPQTDIYGNDNLPQFADNSDFDRITFLEHLLSHSPTKNSNGDMPDGIRRSTEPKRRYSERDSSSERVTSSNKKICREISETNVHNLSADKMEANEVCVNNSISCEAIVIDNLDLTQSSNESDHNNIEPCSPSSSHISRNSYNISESPAKSNQNKMDSLKNFKDESKTESKVIDVEILSEEKEFQSKEGEVVVSATDEKHVKDGMKHFQDDWDSFDEMCNASEPEIFSQCLNKLISSKNTSNSQTDDKESSPLKSHKQRQILSPASNSGMSSGPSKQKDHGDKPTSEDSLLAHLNESVFWRDENEPELKISSKDRKSVLQQEHNKYRTPVQKQKNTVKDDVTPPANYSAMKTPDLKKELKKFGLKPSLTKKQAKIMLRYIYDQLHPYITVSDSEEDSTDDAEGNLPSPFKVPGPNTRAPRSPAKKTKGMMNKLLSKNDNSRVEHKHTSVPARRNLSSQIDQDSQIDRDSDCDELSLSQESSSSSTADVAEEMLFDDLGEINSEYMPLTQDATSSDLLPAVVESHIKENPELLEKVLLHEPIWIEQFLDELKAQNYKFKMDELMDYFDDQCITFRTQQGQQSRMKKKERKEARKKKSPVKKKGKKRGNSTTNSGMDSPSSTSS